jgi:hypothetical protein
VLEKDVSVKRGRKLRMISMPNIPMWLHERIERVIEYYQVNEKYDRCRNFEEKVKRTRTSDRLLSLVREYEILQMDHALG